MQFNQVAFISRYYVNIKHIKLKTEKSFSSCTSNGWTSWYRL